MHTKPDRHCVFLFFVRGRFLKPIQLYPMLVNDLLPTLQFMQLHPGGNAACISRDDAALAAIV